MSKRFGETQALTGAQLTLSPGRVHALIGGNGSGKSTMIKILAGVHPADSGTATIFGTTHDLRSFTPAEAQAEGLRFVHQDLGLFDDMSVEENVALAIGYPFHRATIARGALRESARVLLDRFELDVDPRTPVGELGPADRAMLAVARALHDAAGGRRILVLDEPTASLPEAEATRLITALRRIAAAGQTILFVGHKLQEVRAVADDVTVFRDGIVAGSLLAEDADESVLIDLIAGAAGAMEARAPSRRGSARSDHVRIAVDGLRSGPLQDVTFTAAAGEIVGICGLLGSGRTRLLRLLCGELKPEAGSIRVDGKVVRPTLGRHAVGGNVAFVAENRLQTTFPDLSVRNNLSMSTLDRYFVRGLLSRRRERRSAVDAIDRFGVRTPSDAVPISTLSGGNQQKTVIARALASDPTTVLLDEPTIGVDVVARAQIHQILRQVVDRSQVTVLVVSSDLEELEQLCDRVLILHNGRVTAEVRAPDATPTRLLDHLHNQGTPR